MPVSASIVKTILFADDDDDNSELLMELFALLAYRAFRARNGKELLDLVEKHAPNLVILDVEMPVMDGNQTVQILRQDPRFREIPVLALTATALQGDRELFQRQGFTDCMSKPFSIPALARMLGKYLT